LLAGEGKDSGPETNRVAGVTLLPAELALDFLVDQAPNEGLEVDAGGLGELGQAQDCGFVDELVEVPVFGGEFTLGVWHIF
jgi:hypothetical protein